MKWRAVRLCALCSHLARIVANSPAHVNRSANYVYTLSFSSFEAHRRCCDCPVHQERKAMQIALRSGPIKAVKWLIAARAAAGPLSELFYCSVRKPFEAV